MWCLTNYFKILSLSLFLLHTHTSVYFYFNLGFWFEDRFLLPIFINFFSEVHKGLFLVFLFLVLCFFITIEVFLFLFFKKINEKPISLNGFWGVLVLKGKSFSYDIQVLLYSLNVLGSNRYICNTVFTNVTNME